MARRKKQKDLEEAIDEKKAAESGHNSELTDGEKMALTIQHKRFYVETLAEKKAADAAFKNACKKAKAELGKDAVADIKDMIAIEELGAEAIRANIERQHKVARWMSLPVGATPSFFEEDRQPAEDRAYEEGKRAGMAGAAARPSYDPSVPQYQRFLDGFHDGNAILAQGIQKKREPSAPPASGPVNGADGPSTTDRPFGAPPEQMPTAPAVPA